MSSTQETAYGVTSSSTKTSDVTSWMGTSEVTTEYQTTGTTGEPENGGISMGLVIGCSVAGGVVGLALIIILIYCVACRKSRNPRIMRMRKNTMSHLAEMKRNFQKRAQDKKELPHPSSLDNLEDLDKSPPRAHRTTDATPGILTDQTTPVVQADDNTDDIVPIDHNGETLPPPAAAGHIPVTKVPGYISMATKDVKSSPKPGRGKKEQLDSNDNSHQFGSTNRLDVSNRIVPGPPGSDPISTPKPHKVPKVKTYVNAPVENNRHNPDVGKEQRDDEDSREDYENTKDWQTESTSSASLPNLAPREMALHPTHTNISKAESMSHPQKGKPPMVRPKQNVGHDHNTNFPPRPQSQQQPEYDNLPSKIKMKTSVPLEPDEVYENTAFEESGHSQKPGYQNMQTIEEHQRKHNQLGSSSQKPGYQNLLAMDEEAKMHARANDKKARRK